MQNEFNKLDSTNKNISRQITVLQTQIEIGEICRGTNTDDTDDADEGNKYTFKA